MGSCRNGLFDIRLWRFSGRCRLARNTIVLIYAKLLSVSCFDELGGQRFADLLGGRLSAGIVFPSTPLKKDSNMQLRS